MSVGSSYQIEATWAKDAANLGDRAGRIRDVLERVERIYKIERFACVVQISCIHAFEIDQVGVCVIEVILYVDRINAASEMAAQFGRVSPVAAADNKNPPRHNILAKSADQLGDHPGLLPCASC